MTHFESRPTRGAVLLVDDDAHTLIGLAELLASHGVVVVPCRGFAEAKAYALANPIDALLTDVRLGAHNGLHLVQIVRTAHPHAQLIAFTGYEDQVLRRDADAAGATFLVKPLDLSALLHALGVRSGSGVYSRGADLERTP